MTVRFDIPAYARQRTADIFAIRQKEHVSISDNAPSTPLIVSSLTPREDIFSMLYTFNIGTLAPVKYCDVLMRWLLLIFFSLIAPLHGTIFTLLSRPPVITHDFAQSPSTPPAGQSSGRHHWLTTKRLQLLAGCVIASRVTRSMLTAGAAPAITPRLSCFFSMRVASPIHMIACLSFLINTL